MSIKRDDVTVSLDRSLAIRAAERLLHSGNQIDAGIADLLLAAARPGPDRIDIEGRRDSRTDQIRYLGFATRQPNGLYRVLADVGGSLCIVEVSLYFDPLPAAAPRVAIGEDASLEGPR